MQSIFVSVVGQDDNIGDSVLRRAMLTALRSPELQFHILVGPASDGYLAGLGIDPSDVTYRDRAQWISSMSVKRGNGRTSFLANAGELVTMRGPLHFGRDLIPTLLQVRRRGGKLVQIGTGIRDVSRRRQAAKWSVLRRFDLVAWRDQPSRDYASIGRVIPDWGFLSRDPLNEAFENRESQRRYLAVSLRGDRPFPSQQWCTAVQRLADHLDLEIVTFAQVKRDDERARDIAKHLSGRVAVAWSTDDHPTQEHAVRSLFRESGAVVSDRLHALIIGATEGAYPLGLPPRKPEKLIRTLAPVGFESFLSSSEEVERRLGTLETSRMQEDLYVQMIQAEAALTEVVGDVKSLIGIK